MIDITNTKIFGYEAAIRGMRNPMNSWDKSDSGCGCSHEYEIFGNCDLCDKYIGKQDYNLMLKLSKAGTDHAKFMRYINVTLDINAPLYWWKEFDTYKVGTVANSCSTMHKIADKEFTLKDFSCEHLEGRALNTLEDMVDELNYWRDYYLAIKKQNVVGADTKAKDIWWQMIQLLPSSYNQRRTIDLNFEVLLKQYRERKNHKLDEWHIYCDWIKEIALLNEIIKKYGY